MWAKGLVLICAWEVFQYLDQRSRIFLDLISFFERSKANRRRN